MTSVKDKLELIGIVAVIVSILILGYEIRQNTDTYAAQAVFELNESARQSLFQEATDPNLASLIGNNGNGNRIGPMESIGTACKSRSPDRSHPAVGCGHIQMRLNRFGFLDQNEVRIQHRSD